MRKVLYILGLLTDEDIAWLTSVGQAERLRPGNVLIHSNSSLDYLYVVLEGKLHVSVADHDQQVVATLESGEIVGELSLIDSRPATATVTAAENALVFWIRRDDIMDRIRSNLGFSSRFYHALALLLAHRLRNTVGKLNPNNNVSDSIELDAELMNRLALAERRYDDIVEKLKVYK